VSAAALDVAPRAGTEPAPWPRPRRLRRTAALRRLVAETRLSPADLVLPLFVKEGISEPQPIPSMPGVQQHTVESMRPVAEAAARVGLGGVILFGVPARKDARGSSADDDNGIVPLALRRLRADLGDSCVIVSDLCLDEFTDHGHCGIVDADGVVDNDATLERYASVAVCQAAAGAHVVAPSGMMDGQVRAIRRALDGAGFIETAILAYAAKYASAWYGPFRDAAECAPAYGDRSTYQQDPANGREALREVALDVAEGADAVMVKPAGSYLDVVYRVAQQVDVPVAAYQVSGEYAMVEAAAARGWINRERVIDESVVSVRRAGADIVLTYWALEVALRLGGQDASCRRIVEPPGHPTPSGRPTSRRPWPGSLRA
jgi:porphobilinogen synthase